MITHSFLMSWAKGRLGDESDKKKFKLHILPGSNFSCLSKEDSLPVDGFDHYPMPSHSSVQFSRSVMSDYLPPHESQHARPLCPSPTPGVHSDLCPSSQWCHPAISSSVVPFLSCPQSLPASVGWCYMFVLNFI